MWNVYRAHCNFYVAGRNPELNGNGKDFAIIEEFLAKKMFQLLKAGHLNHLEKERRRGSQMFTLKEKVAALAEEKNTFWS